MIEFDEWFKSLNEGERTTYFLGQEGKVSKEAWDYQQAKIDELQGRIDDALHYINYNHSNGIIIAVDILKGNKDE